MTVATSQSTRWWQHVGRTPLKVFDDIREELVVWQGF